MNWEKEFDKKFTFCGDPKEMIEFNRRFSKDDLENWDERSRQRLKSIKSFIKKISEEATDDRKN